MGLDDELSEELSQLWQGEQLVVAVMPVRVAAGLEKDLNAQGFDYRKEMLGGRDALLVVPSSEALNATVGDHRMGVRQAIFVLLFGAVGTVVAYWSGRAWAAPLFWMFLAVGAVGWVRLHRELERRLALQAELRARGV